MKGKRQVVFVESVHEILQQRLEASGYETHLRYTSTREELMNEMASFEGLVIRSRIALDKEFLDACTHLKFIARSGSGLENIDVDYARSKGIEVFSSPEGNRDAVGEHAIGMLLMLFNRLHLADREVREGEWNRERNRGLELQGKTVGIIGYGVMGSSLGRKLSGFDCAVLAYDKYKTGFGNATVTEASLDRLLEESDIISLHLPQTGETKHYVNDAFISRVKKPFFLVNTARGSHVDTAALVSGLQSGKVRGACLDVLEYELPSLQGLNADAGKDALHYLGSSEKVVLSPHVAGWTVESYIKLSTVLAEKILEWQSRHGH